MFGLPYSYRQLSEMDTIPGFQQMYPPGLQYLQFMSGQPRVPDTTDESFGFVKYAMAKMGNRRQTLVTRTFDEHGGMIPLNTVPEIYEPFRQLTRYLLPHLRFEEIDLENDQDLKVLFRRVDGDERDLVEIDDLSSGEKAVVSLFLPFIESQIDVLLSSDEENPESSLATALIDEPDLHLHPTLQVSLVEYLREMADREEAQFIITTHSPTILDSLREDGVNSPPRGCVVETLEPDIWLLRRETDGSLVAAFDMSNATEAAVRVSARHDHQRRLVTNGR